MRTLPLLLVSGLAVAEPIHLTIIDTQDTLNNCSEGATKVMLLLFLSPPAGCVKYVPGRCIMYVPLSGPATALSYTAFSTPDGLLGHELEHCVKQANFHEARTWASER